MNQAVKRSLLVLVTVLSLATAVISVAMALTPPAAAAGTLNLSLAPFATGLSDPVSIANADDGYGRLFIVEREGFIKIVQPGGSVLPTPFLDISDRVTAGGEMGLLGLAFHPEYRDNGTFYVNYTSGTDADRQTRISRFNVTIDPNVADPDSEDILLTVVQPATNHNAGGIHFGPDGYLYIPLGDGGGGNDTSNNAQTLTLALGKLVRIDVDNTGANLAECNNVGGSANYAIPASNPFVGSDGVCDLIWAIGLRNPWRSSFDRLTGDFYMGDVGQGAWEEVDHQPADSTGGENYGWSCFEGNATNPSGGCQSGDVSVHTPPIFEFESTGNCSVINGYVYRGTQYPAMYSRYLVTDYCSGNFWDLVVDDTGLFTPTMHTNLTTSGYVSFGEADDCELYLANINNGTIFHIQESAFSAAVTGGTALCNNRPVALANSYQVVEGQVLTVNAPGVLENDSDLESDPLTAVLATPPLSGSLTLSPDGSFIYTPTSGFLGVDSFTYRAMDSYDESGLATVTIIVTEEANTPPIAANDSYTTTQNASLLVMAPGVLDNDSDGDNDALTAVLDTPPSNGSLTLAPSGAVIYTPTTNFTGTDSFTYHAFDGLDDSNVATVLIDVVEGNAPPVAISNTYTTTRDISLTVPPPGILVNDTDPNDDPLTAVLETASTTGSLTLNPDGSFIFTPTLGFTGEVTFTYRAHDGLAASNAALVTILVEPIIRNFYLPYVALRP